MASKNKCYVVWEGRKKGIFTLWAECEKQIKGVPNARYKGFKSIAEAERALTQKPSFSRRLKKPTVKNLSTETAGQPILKSISVDAACSGNPGVMEYRGVYTDTKEVIFHKKFPKGTNNIGEFLALVHVLAIYSQLNTDRPIYSDSRIAMLWIKQKKSKTSFKYDKYKAHELKDFMERAEEWLQNNRIAVPILKWDTANWGEIPADFGRKQ